MKSDQNRPGGGLLIESKSISSGDSPRSAIFSRRVSRLCANTLLLAAIVLFSWSTSADAPPQSFFSQSASKLLAHDFQDTNLSYLLLDVATGNLIAQRWEDASVPVAMGSLVKPFTALAYASGGNTGFPVFYCGGRSLCWLPQGHGKLDISRAIAYSCNAYFSQLAKQVAPEAAEAAMRRFHLAPVTEWPVSTVLAGLDSGWKNTPDAMARAYLALYRLRSDAEVKPVIEGMQLSAQIGTGRAVGAALSSSGALVKTGTAPCSHHPRSAGDGFAVVLAPADSPRVLLLVRLHGAPGSHAARSAGEILAALERQGEQSR